MAAALCKFAVGKSGLGAAHASYITRLSALDPNDKRREKEDEREEDRAGFIRDEAEERGPSVAETLDRNLDERALAPPSREDERPDRNEDPIFTWNAPSFVTGDSYGIEQPEGSKKPAKDVQENERMVAEKIKNKPWLRTEFTLREKIENVRAYFGTKEEFEKLKGGRTHYRAILSFDVPATNKQIRKLTTKFLQENFPKAIAFGAIHRDTDHPHIHVYIHSRQIDGRKLQLSREQYQSIDEKWAKIYGGFAQDRSVYVEHMRKKDETREWKRAAAQAYREGKLIPLKPERDADRRERLAEQRLSAQRSQARDEGRDPGPRPNASPVIRPDSEKETARLIAKAHVARARVAHLIRSDATEKEIQSATRMAESLRSLLERTVSVRAERGKTNNPGTIYTIQEAKLINQYRSSRELPIKNIDRAARLVAHQKIAEAQLLDAKGRAEAFEARRNLWKFQVEGWDKKVSLNEVERALKEKKIEKLAILSFIRPSKRALIKSHLDYLKEVKGDIQKQMASRSEALTVKVKTSELRHEVATSQLERAREKRAELRRGMPEPTFTATELARMDEIAERNQDAGLLKYVHERAIGKPPPNRERAAAMVGRSLMAGLRLAQAQERRDQARQYFSQRQVPVRDAEGQDHAVSLRDVSPRTLAEAITNQVIRPPGERFSQREIQERAGEQLNRSEQEVKKALDYFNASRQIAHTYCGRAHVKLEQTAPTLSAEQVQEIKEYLPKMRDDHQLKPDLERALPMAEDALKQRTESQRELDPQDRELKRPGLSPERPDRAALDREREHPMPSRDDSFRGR